jgi:hypothetical protein
VSLKRWDLKTGADTLWFSRSNGGVYLLGLDRNGAAIVEVVNDNADGTMASGEIWLVARPGSEKRIYHPDGGDESAMTTLLGTIADAHGLWIGADNGISLYTSASGMKRLSAFAGGPANGCF